MEMALFIKVKILFGLLWLEKQILIKVFYKTEVV